MLFAILKKLKTKICPTQCIVGRGAGRGVVKPVGQAVRRVKRLVGEQELKPGVRWKAGCGVG